MSTPKILGPVETALREAGRVLDLRGAPLTIDLLLEHATELRRYREADGFLPCPTVDVCTDPDTHALLVKRAWAWVLDKYGGSLRKLDGLLPTPVLNAPGASLAFAEFEFHPDGMVSLVYIPDLIWFNGRYEVQSLKKHLVLENFT